MRELVRLPATVVRLAFRADPRVAASTIAGAVIEGLVDATYALWMKFLTEAVVRTDVDAATTWGAVLAFTYMVGALARNRNNVVGPILADRVGYLIDQELFEVGARLPGVEHFERPEYLDRLTVLRGQRPLLSGYTTAMVTALNTAIRAVMVIALLASVHPLAVGLVVFAVPSLVTSAAGQRVTQRVMERVAERQRLAGQIAGITAMPAAAKEVRLLRLGDELLRRQRAVQAGVVADFVKGNAKAAALSFAGTTCFTAGYLATALFTLLLVADGRASAGDVVLVVTLAPQVRGLTAAAAQFTSTTIATARTVGHYDWVKEYARTAAYAGASRPVPERLVKGIRFEAVSFRYPTSDREALQAVSFEIPAGATVALVGENGAGKTTVIKLLSSMYRPTSGTITVDGADLADLHPEEWRDRLSAGFQDYARLEFLLREAVGVGDLRRLDEPSAVGAALARSRAEALVAKLPQGIDTQLGRAWEGGVDLSGGEWQKLAIARAYMRLQPLVLILDEPAAALDAYAEHALFESYTTAMREAAREAGAVTVLVSHRFSTVRMADFIVVLENGEVVEKGTHHELIAAGGLYASLYELQAQAYR